MKWFRGPKGSQQDKALFLASEELLKEEEVERFLSLLREEKSFYGDERARILEYLRFFEASRPFQDRHLQEALASLLRALRELKILTAVHFLIFPRNQTGSNQRHSLHPDYFILGMEDISLKEHQFFCSAEERLQLVIGRVEKAYRDFRRTAGKRLGH